MEVTQQADRDLLPDGAEAMRTVTFAAGSATAALAVALENDNLQEVLGGVTVEVQPGTAYTVGAPASATVTVVDTDNTTATPANLVASPGTGPGEVVLSWNAHALHARFVRHQYRYKTDGGYEGWTDIPNSGQHDTPTGEDGSNLTGYTVTGLVGGQAHTFEVRTVGLFSKTSDSSNEDSATPRSAAVSFEAATYSVDEGATVEVTVSLSGAPGREVTVPVTATAAGGATAQGETGADWSGVPENVTFGATDTEQSFTLAATQDMVDDDSEGVVLSFGTLPDGVTAGTLSGATVTIVDDDAAGVTVSATALTVTEQDTTGDSYTVVLDTEPTHDVTVTVGGHSGTDVSLSASTLTFTPSNWDRAQTVTVTALNDDDTADDAVALTHAATSTDGNYSGITIAGVAVTVTDNDTTAPAVTLVLSDGSIGENGGVSTVTATVSPASAAAFTVTVAAAAVSPAVAADFRLSANTVLSFAENATTSTGSVTITGVDNDVDAADKTVTVSGTVSAASVTAPANRTLTLEDDDAAGVTVSATALTVTEQDTTGDSYTVVLDTEPTHDVTVTVGGHSGTDVSVSASTLTFTPSNWDQAQTVTVTALNDDDTADDAVTLTHAATSTDGNYSGITIAGVAVTVTDNDTTTPTVTLVLSDDSIGENGGVSTVTATVSPASAAAFTVTVAAAAVSPAVAADFRLSANTVLSFAENATTSTGSVTITGVDNDVDAADKTVTVSGTVSATSVTAPVNRTLTLEDDDAAGVTVSATALTVTEQDTTGDSYTVVLDTEPTHDVTVTVGGHSGTDVSVSASTLTFTPSNWDQAQTVTVTALNDDDTANDAVALTHAATSTDGNYSGITIAGVAVTVTDNDTTTPAVTLALSDDSIGENGGVSTVTATVSPASAAAFTVTVAAAAVSPAVAADFRLSANTVLSFAENATASTGSVTITGVDNDVDAADKTVTVSGTVSATSVTAPPNRTLTLEDDDAATPLTNNAPVFDDPTAEREVAENSAADTEVGGAIPAAKDADTGDTLEYSLEGTDAGSFTFDASTRQITTRDGVTYNYEAKSSYSVRVKASDGTDSATLAVTIRLTDVLEQSARPAQPRLSPVRGSTTSLLARWTRPGRNGGPAITGYDVEYREAPSGGWREWAHDDATVTTTITGLTAGRSYQARVQAKNGERDSEWSEASEAVVPSAAITPTVAAVSVTSVPELESDTYGRGETIRFTVEFNEKVVVAGAPHFTFSLGNRGAARRVDAAYESGSGMAALVFAYTVREGDEDDNGIFLMDGGRFDDRDSPVALAGGSITAVAGGAAADLSWSGGGTERGHKVDGSRALEGDAPTVVGRLRVTSWPVRGGAAYGMGDTIVFTLTFSEKVRVKGQPQPALVFELGGEEREARYHGLSDTDYEAGSPAPAPRSEAVKLHFEYRVGAGDRDDDGVSVGADAVRPGGATIRSAVTGFDADLSHAAVAPDPDHRVAAGTATEPAGPGVTIIDAKGNPLAGHRLVIREGGQGRYGLKLNTRPAHPVHLKAIMSDGDEDLAVLPSFTQPSIAPGAWGGPRWVDIAAADDADSVDGERVFLHRVHSKDPEYNDLLLPDVVVVEADDDPKESGPAPPGISAVAVASVPELTSSGGSTPDTYGRGETIRFRVEFSGQVTVGGRPHFTFSLGNRNAGRRVDAPYESGTGTEALEFGYEVQRGDEDDNGIFLLVGRDFTERAGPVGLGRGGSILAVAGGVAAADLAHDTGRGAQGGHQVDGSRPEDPVSPVPTPPTNPTVDSLAVNSWPQSGGEVYRSGDTIVFTVTFSEKVRVEEGQPALAFDLGGARHWGVYHGLSDDDFMEGGPAPTPRSEAAKLHFAYQVDRFDRDAAGVEVGELSGAMDLRRGTIRSAETGLDADLGHAAVGPLSDPVDGLAAEPATTAEPLTAEFRGLPSEHDGRTAFRFRIEFSEEVAVSAAAMRDDALTVSGGTVTGAARVDGRADRWSIEVTPSGAGEIGISLPPGPDCAEAGAVCTADGRPLTTGLAVLVAGPPVEPLTASFEGMPAEHGGEGGLHFRVAFSEDIGISYRSLREDAFAVSGGRVTGGRRVDDRRDLFRMTVRPDSDGDVTITLPAGRDCGVSGAICTKGDDRRQLTNSPSATVTGPVGIKVADARVEEGDGAMLAFPGHAEPGGGRDADGGLCDGGRQRARGRRLPGGERDAGVPGRRVVEDGRGGGVRRLARRGGGDADAAAVERLVGAGDGRGGDGDDQELGPAAAGAAGAVRADGGGAGGRAGGGAVGGVSRAWVPGPGGGPRAAAGHGAGHRARPDSPPRRRGRRGPGRRGGGGASGPIGGAAGPMGMATGMGGAPGSMGGPMGMAGPMGGAAGRWAWGPARWAAARWAWRRTGATVG